MMHRRLAPRRGHADGYALVEVMFGLMLIAMLSALVMPGLARGTGPAVLRVSALDIAALLRDDRTAAIGSGHMVATLISAGGVRSGATGATVTLPAGVALRAPARIRFQPDGHASGGEIAMASATARLTIAVSPDTGAIRVAVP